MSDWCRTCRSCVHNTINVPLYGESTIISIIVLCLCIAFAVFWVIHQAASYAWIGQDILVSSLSNISWCLHIYLYNHMHISICECISVCTISKAYACPSILLLYFRSWFTHQMPCLLQFECVRIYYISSFTSVMIVQRSHNFHSPYFHLSQASYSSLLHLFNRWSF